MFWSGNRITFTFRNIKEKKITTFLNHYIVTTEAMIADKPEEKDAAGGMPGGMPGGMGGMGGMGM